MSSDSQDEGSDVLLYVYDMSKGMAKSLSSIFLGKVIFLLVSCPFLISVINHLAGKEIAGLWHTAIVVYGRE
jgi:hypothetical protein